MLINRDEALRILDDLNDGSFEWASKYIEMKKLPTIEEPIKCKDCIWWTKADDSLQGRCSMFGMYPTGAWFCANAERKEGAKE